MGLYNLWPCTLVWLGQTKKRLFNKSPFQSSLMATVFGTRTWGHLTSLGTTIRSKDSKQWRHWRKENIHPMLGWTGEFVFPSSLLAFLPPPLGLCRPHSISFLPRFLDVSMCLIKIIRSHVFSPFVLKDMNILSSCYIYWNYIISYQVYIQIN